MGYSSSFAKLASNDADSKFEYTSGIIFVGAFFLVFFVMWGIALAICRWLGSEQVGFISGDRMKPADLSAKRMIVKKRPQVVRGTFLFCALLWIIFVIIYLFVGLKGVYDAKAILDTEYPVSVHASICRR